MDDGITPADAGKTAVYNLRQRVNEDHPRGCGENVQKVFPIFPISGSPPRMRGKLASSIFRVSAMRITPADAGKTAIWCVFKFGGMDHPRGCGENTKKIL